MLFRLETPDVCWKVIGIQTLVTFITSSANEVKDGESLSGHIQQANSIISLLINVLSCDGDITGRRIIEDHEASRLVVAASKVSVGRQENSS